MTERETEPDAAAETDRGTRTRLLDAAERLFAEQTYAATSLRQITAEAEANLAAVHYHFGSKEALFEAVFHRRIGPVNAERLRRLGDLRDAAAAEDPPLEEVLMALFEPAVRLQETPEGRYFARIISRSLVAEGDHWRSVRNEYREVRDAFVPILKRACPHLSDTALVWRLHFALSGLCLVLSNPERIGALTGGQCDPTDVEQMIGQLVQFTSTGLAAPDIAPSTPAPSKAS